MDKVVESHRRIETHSGGWCFLLIKYTPDASLEFKLYCGITSLPIVDTNGFPSLPLVCVFRLRLSARGLSSRCFPQSGLERLSAKLI